MIEIYCDGGCAGNPGPAGWGYLIRSNSMILNKSYGPCRREDKDISISTNQAAELTAFLMAIRDYIYQWRNHSSRVIVTSDSAYLLNGLRQRWYVKWEKYADTQGRWYNSKGILISNEWIWKQIVNIIKKLESEGVLFEYVHVKGHSGHPFNEEADRLASKGVEMAISALEYNPILSFNEKMNV